MEKESMGGEEPVISAVVPPTHFADFLLNSLIPISTIHPLTALSLKHSSPLPLILPSFLSSLLSTFGSPWDPLRTVGLPPSTLRP